MRRDLTSGLTAAAQVSGGGLARAALVIARIEFPRLDPAPSLARLDAMGEGARLAIARHARGRGGAESLQRVQALNDYLFRELGFSGNREKYEDPRNSCLNDVLERRTGIPITLSVVYMEVARRAGVDIDGVNFPGHFLVRCPDLTGPGDILIDPFHEGALLSEHDCRELLHRHVGAEVPFSRSLLVRATDQQILVRMLLNLKRIYVQMRSFPQARDVTELLLSLMPSALSELRDRGLLAYHLNDVTGALRDLQTYLKLSGVGDVDGDTREEHEQIWEHVKMLRRRVASLN